MIQVLFVCVHNAGRSQMAEAFFNELAPEGMRAVSGGTVPGESVNPVVVQAMAEVGIDIADRVPQEASPEFVQASDRIITMGCGVQATCPLYLGMKIDEDWGLDDPAGREIEDVRTIRDAVRRRVELLIEQLLQEEERS